MSKPLVIDVLKLELEGNLPNWLSPLGRGQQELRDITAKNRAAWLARRDRVAAAKVSRLDTLVGKHFSKAWSDAAREAALEVRRENSGLKYWQDKVRSFPDWAKQTNSAFERRTGASMDAPDRELLGALVDKASPDQIEKLPAIQRAYRAAYTDSAHPTNQQPGFGTEAFEQSREFDLAGKRVVGYDKAQQYLLDEAMKPAGGEVANGHKAVVVIGPSGAGKSTIMNTLAAKDKAAIIDADEAKKIIPEYDHGLGASGVHEESHRLTFGPGSPLDTLARRGGNMLIQKIGANPASISKLRDGLKAMGYQVDLINLDIDPAEAFRRRVSRYLATGRISSSSYSEALTDNDGQPRRTYDALKDTFHNAISVDVNAAHFINDGGGTALAGKIGLPVKSGGDDGRQAGPRSSGSGATGTGRALSAAEAQRSAAQAAGGYAPLKGLPDKPLKFGDDWYVPGPLGKAQDAARSYITKAGLPYDPPHNYQKVDKERATRIAGAFETMKHDPDNPQVKAAYDALAKETLAQWQAIKQTGLKVEWIKPGQPDPYAQSPRLAAMDVVQHNHLWGLPTDAGFGSGQEAEHVVHNNPMLAPTDEVVGGRQLLVNDVFRIVHDYFGHFKEGVGFRADGEENAWRSHAAMYSKLARGAMTSETRGQNSWVNFGPYGEANRSAGTAETHYAPQKIGLMPEWTWQQGRMDETTKLAKAWSDAAREASAEARQARAHGRLEGNKQLDEALGLNRGNARPPGMLLGLDDIVPANSTHLNDKVAKIVASPDGHSNCCAWAMGDATRWWWPSHDIFDNNFWPDGVKKDGSVDSFDDLLLRKSGGTITDSNAFEPGYVKLALYADDDGPTHIARQLSDGSWLSKMGANAAVEHQSLHDATGGLYGNVDRVYRVPLENWKKLSSMS